TFGNGVAGTRTFDLDYRLQNLSDEGVLNLTYTYDAANNVAAIADAVTSGSSQHFAYDSLNRLVTAAGPYGASTYTYDSVGNRLTQSLGGSMAAYAYTARSNQLASINANG